MRADETRAARDNDVHKTPEMFARRRYLRGASKKNYRGASTRVMKKTG